MISGYEILVQIPASLAGLSEKKRPHCARMGWMSVMSGQVHLQKIRELGSQRETE